MRNCLYICWIVYINVVMSNYITRIYTRQVKQYKAHAVIYTKYGAYCP